MENNLYKMVHECNNKSFQVKESISVKLEDTFLFVWKDGKEAVQF